jgi:arsenite methyltransferase
MTMERAVQERYSAASISSEPGLCCPVEYDPKYLAAIPSEVLDKDYGCGDPVSHVRAGEQVLDLGSGTGKVCFIAAQIVGAAGSVLGVDVNADMLAVARNAQQEVALRIGFSNVRFGRARIEDLALDLDFLNGHLKRHPVHAYDDLAELEDLSARLRTSSPLVPDESVDVAISNCVLNLVEPGRKQRMFTELARVLRPGGRAVISDIVSDVDVPVSMQADPQLWSGCYSGAMREDRFLHGFAQAGLTGMTILRREDGPWDVIEGVEFRSITVAAYKAATPAGSLTAQAAMYRGPFAAVRADSGLELERGCMVPLRPGDLGPLLAEPCRSHIMLYDTDDRREDDQQPPGPGLQSGKLRYRPAGEGITNIGPAGNCNC